jgi:predicted GIY-YIG superfamily endonuclease
MNHIYQFLNKNEEVIYVGITQDIKTRIRSQHFTAGGHLPKDCYEEAEMVLYSECLSHDDARIKERYLMHTQQRLFSRDLIRKVNQDMIDRKPVDTSGLPAHVVQSIRSHKFSREDINRAFADARRRVFETA